MSKYIITNKSFRNMDVGTYGTHLHFDDNCQHITEDENLAKFVAENFSQIGYSVISAEDAEKQAAEEAARAEEAAAKAAELAEFKKSLTPAMRGKLSKQLRELKVSWDSAEDQTQRSEIEEKIKDLEAKLA